MKAKLKIGSKFTLTDNALENYGEKYRDQVFTVSHVATSVKDHPGYDAVAGGALYDATELPFSVYDCEINRA
jgi:hypothetical protein